MNNEEQLQNSPRTLQQSFSQILCFKNTIPNWCNNMFLK